MIILFVIKLFSTQRVYNFSPDKQDYMYQGEVKKFPVSIHSRLFPSHTISWTNFGEAIQIYHEIKIQLIRGQLDPADILTLPFHLFRYICIVCIKENVVCFTCPDMKKMFSWNMTLSLSCPTHPSTSSS